MKITRNISSETIVWPHANQWWAGGGGVTVWITFRVRKKNMSVCNRAAHHNSKTPVFYADIGVELGTTLTFA